MSGLKQSVEQHYISDEVKLDYIVTVIDGEKLDTQVTLDGVFFVGGDKRMEFKEKMEALVNEYRI